MSIFEIPVLFDKIEEALAKGEDPKPFVDALVETGPSAIDECTLAIEEKEGLARLARDKAKEISGRAAANEERAKKMRTILAQILANHFTGKVKTALGTYWVVEGTETLRIRR